MRWPGGFERGEKWRNLAIQVNLTDIIGAPRAMRARVSHSPISDDRPSAMHRTIFDTPIVNTTLRGISLGFLKVTGWKIEGQLPEGVSKCVLIAAPHTSNWDLPYTLMVAFALRLQIYWMGKSSIFSFPFGPLMRWLGGIAVNRSQASNLVDSCAQELVKADGAVHLVVPPEGTRSKTRYWKTGFYYIALQAQVPIVMAYMDYSRKASGLGPLFYPSGDIEKDMVAIKAFYAPFKGKNADQFETPPENP